MVGETANAEGSDQVRGPQGLGVLGSL